jgi:hypothetical protein
VKRWIFALTLIAVIRVAATDRVFSATHDEPAHLSAGYEWLNGSYTVDLSHPPLARALCAFPLWLQSNRAPQEGNVIDRLNDLLYRGRYDQNLAHARYGTLLILIAAILGVAAWTRHSFGDLTAIIAVALFTNLPPILGHAGVATTDLAVAAALPWALLALERYLAQPTLARGALLGLALGIGVLAKFSFLVYFPPAALVVLLMRRPLRANVRSAALALVTALLVIWSGYRFEFAKASTVMGDDGSLALFRLLMPESLAQRAVHVPLPAVSLPFGLAMVRWHNRQPNVSYLLGETGSSWWFYFPVVLFFKTPLPFLLLLACGLRKPAWMFALITLAILAVAMTSHINIGVRHVLPFYVPASVVAAYGLTRVRLAGAALALWLVIGVAIGHPDYLAWFNEAAGRDPSRIVVDSNLEWGQDGLRLARAAHEMHIDHLKLFYATNIRLPNHGVDAERLSFGPQSGWIAIGEAPLRFFGKPEMFGWLQDHRPVRRIGKSVRLYHIP